MTNDQSDSLVHPTPRASSTLFMSLNAMVRAYSKINPGKADDLQLIWVESLSEASGKSEQAILMELCSPQDPFLRSLQRLEAECADFARSCEEEGTRGHQLAMEAWVLESITSAAERAAFPFAAPLWALVRELNDGEIPPQPEGADAFAGLIDGAVVDATGSLTDRLLKLCELVRMVTHLCTTEELRGQQFLIPLVDLMCEGASVVEGEG